MSNDWGFLGNFLKGLVVNPPENDQQVYAFWCKQAELYQTWRGIPQSEQKRGNKFLKDIHTN